jgi:hypothetical protein
VKYATLYYCDGDKKVHKIESDEYHNDFKHDGGQSWDDAEESEDEDDADSTAMRCCRNTSGCPECVSDAE